MRQYIIGALAITLVVFSGVAAWAADDDNKEYSWKKFSFEYPAEGWKVEEVEKKDGTVNLKVSTEGDRVALILVFSDEFADVNEKIKDSPVALNLAFGTTIALKLANNEKNRILTTIGPTTVGGEGELGTRFLILDPEKPEFTTLDAFHYLPEEVPNHIAFGVIITKGQAGKMEEDPKYLDKLYETLAIIESIDIEGDGDDDKK